MSQTRQEATVRGWLEVIPDEVIRARPVLSLGFAWALLSVGEFDGVEDRLRDAERWLPATTDTVMGSAAWLAGMVVANEEEYRRLPGTIVPDRAALRAGPVR